MKHSVLCGTGRRPCGESTPRPPNVLRRASSIKGEKWDTSPARQSLECHGARLSAEKRGRTRARTHHGHHRVGKHLLLLLSFFLVPLRRRRHRLRRWDSRVIDIPQKAGNGTKWYNKNGDKNRRRNFGDALPDISLGILYQGFLCVGSLGREGGSVCCDRRDSK